MDPQYHWHPGFPRPNSVDEHEQNLRTLHRQLNGLPLGGTMFQVGESPSFTPCPSSFVQLPLSGLVTRTSSSASIVDNRAYLTSPGVWMFSWVVGSLDFVDRYPVGTRLYAYERDGSATFAFLDGFHGTTKGTIGAAPFWDRITGSGCIFLPRPALIEVQLGHVQGSNRGWKVMDFQAVHLFTDPTVGAW